MRDLRPAPLEASDFAAFLKVDHLAICVPSASQIIRFPHILACYIVITDPGVFWCGKLTTLPSIC